MPEKAVAITLADLDGKLFATVPEVACLLRLDHKTVRRRIARGYIPAISDGGRFRVPVAWLREQAGAGAGAPVDQLAGQPPAARGRTVASMDADGLHVQAGTGK